MNTFICLVPGIGIFVLMPSVLFCLVEPGWTYLDSVYYTSISLSTIGLGDLVSASNPKVEAQLGGWIWVYQSFTMVWLLCGLSFIVMVTEKLRKAVRKAYKKLHKEEKRILSTSDYQESHGVLQEKPREAGL